MTLLMDYLMHDLKRFLLFILATLLPLSAVGHPPPEIPVQGDFKSDGAVKIQVDVDPRCFADDPINAPYLKKRVLKGMSKAQREALLSKAKHLVATTLRFHFEPPVVSEPAFQCRFQERPNAAPDSEGGVPVMIVLSWEPKDPPKLNGYRLEALKTGEFSVQFLNTIHGKKQKVHVLFPGEKSYRLDLTARR